jgi:hypothetical protein
LKGSNDDAAIGFSRCSGNELLFFWKASKSTVDELRSDYLDLVCRGGGLPETFSRNEVLLLPENGLREGETALFQRMAVVYYILSQPCGDEFPGAVLGDLVPEGDFWLRVRENAEGGITVETEYEYREDLN